MGSDEGWHSQLSFLSESQKEMITGGGLSKRFSKLPLWLSHPSNIGAFYGFLVSIALILPYIMTEEYWFPLWIYHASLLTFSAAILGLFSRIINATTGRMPLPVNRKILYPMPFIGFALLTLIHLEIASTKLQFYSWVLLMLPGPLYVHMAWAPRWRLLCMVEDGKKPFAALEKSEVDKSQEVSEVVGDDSEIMEVVEGFDSED